ncbi:hypothetical protein O1611_g6680 [Lasiodiplodia mahajangana]|uniref:Uncharacterized protein n=1 Tax=Lasiodiplodia mahajangana TaxID=1108764 RepID=A0ACC2JIA0_9PEZI|nr:hypothetical protein O1611_g6680 [Lasiodiplodia mahajangana]
MGIFAFLNYLKFPVTSMLPDLYTFQGLFQCLGLFITLRSVYRFVQTLYTYDLLYYFNIYRRSPRIVDYLQTNDRTLPWAFIINASSPLGRAFAEELADLGFNLVLHAASRQKTDELHLALQRKYPSRDVRTFVHNPRSREESILDGENIMKWAEEAVDCITLKVFVNIIGPPVGVCAAAPATIDAYAATFYNSILERRVRFPTAVLSTLSPMLKLWRICEN